LDAPKKAHFEKKTIRGLQGRKNLEGGNQGRKKLVGDPGS